MGRRQPGLNFAHYDDDRRKSGYEKGVVNGGGGCIERVVLSFVLGVESVLQLAEVCERKKLMKRTWSSGNML